MSFDVNPLGHQMHLKQLEREVKQQQLFEQAGDTTDRQAQPSATAIPGWVSRFAEMFAVLRRAD